MGLDFSHTDAHWAYGGFHRFREALAKHEGFDLNAMAGFDGSRSWGEIGTPLKPLLDHSDCDGDLLPEQCAQIAPRLREVVLAVWPDPHEHNHRAGLALADGLDLAAHRGERFEFE
jgi:hypothetical protein